MTTFNHCGLVVRQRLRKRSQPKRKGPGSRLPAQAIRISRSVSCSHHRPDLLLNSEGSRCGECPLRQKPESSMRARRGAETERISTAIRRTSAVDLTTCPSSALWRASLISVPPARVQRSAACNVYARERCVRRLSCFVKR